MKALLLNKFFLGILCIVLTSNACSKDDELGWVNATVMDFGDPAVDGCGILIRIDDNDYFPVSLEKRYAKDRQKVKIKYILQDDYYGCGFGLNDKYKKIEITKIKER